MALRVIYAPAQAELLSAMVLMSFRDATSLREWWRCRRTYSWDGRGTYDVRGPSIIVTRAACGKMSI